MSGQIGNPFGYEGAVAKGRQRGIITNAEKPLQPHPKRVVSCEPEIAVMLTNRHTSQRQGILLLYMEPLTYVYPSCITTEYAVTQPSTYHKKQKLNVFLAILYI